MNGRMDCEKEIMSENEEFSSCESLTSVGFAQSMRDDNEKLCNQFLLPEDPTSSETSWTDEKHSLYLNSIEDAFVSSLYQRGYYTHPCKRLQVDQGEISSVPRLDLNEEVESGFSDGHFVYGFPESQSESEMPRIYRHVQNYSKRCRLKKMGGSNKVQQSDRNERKIKRKFHHETSRGMTQLSEDDSASNFCGQDRFTENRIISGISNSQEDQVVPSIDEISAKEDCKPR